MTTPRIRILTGHERYGDPWHPFVGTSALVAELLRDKGFQVDDRPDVPETLAGLDEVDLLVVNAGGGDPQQVVEPTPEWQAAHAALGDWLGRGGRLLALHASANTFPDWSEWPGLLGGQWVRGTSWHPEKDVAEFLPAPGAVDHPVWRGLERVEVDDERYTDLRVDASSTALVHQLTDGAWHVMGWARGGRVLYDGLGHDEGSYLTTGRVQLLLNEVDWLLAD